MVIFLVMKKGKKSEKKKEKEDVPDYEKIIKELEENLEGAAAEGGENFKRLQYLQAEFDNYKKRVAREKEEFKKYANEGLILKILDVVDNLERALCVEKNEGNKSLFEGIEITYRQLMGILTSEGVDPISAMGECFDPHCHEAVTVEMGSDQEEDEVVGEFQKGYRMKEKVIRHSKVKVAKKE